MNRLVGWYCKGLEALIALGLAVMVVLVFGNVLMRYAFNSGITLSEELSRWIFVWVTFLGAIVALREHGHLGTDMLVSRLPSAARKACFAVSGLLMLGICWLIFEGSVAQARINLDVVAPSSGLSVAIFYASGIVFAVSAAGILLLDLWAAATGRLGQRDMAIRESEEQREDQRP